jgi:hypothetical protein
MYSSYGKLDSRIEVDGDAEWIGVDMRDQIGRDRSMLAPGMLARSENKRLRFGTIDRRLGMSFPVDFNPVFTNELSGAIVYRNPNGEEVMLVAQFNSNFVWQLQFGKDAIQIPLAAGAMTGATYINFTQAFDKVIMLRPGLGPLQWDGLAAGGFAAFAAPIAGRTAIPLVWAGTPFANRVIYYYPLHFAAGFRDVIFVSDVVTYNQFLDPDYRFRINAGEANKLTCVLPYFKGSVVCFMDHSIHMLENFTLNDPITEARQRLLSDRINGIGLNIPILVGSDVFFLSRPGGFYRLSQIVQEQIAAEPIPISRKIQPLIDSINWPAAIAWGCSAALGDYAYFALPRNGSLRNNMICVFNTVTNEWESAPDWFLDSTFCIDRLLVTDYNNERRVFALDFANSHIYLLYDGFTDDIGGDSLPIQDRFETRGYICGDRAAFKRFTRCKIGVRTLDPDTVISSLVDGINEEKPIGIITKDWLKFYTHGKSLFNPATDDPHQAYREDYSVQEEANFLGDDFNDLPLGPIIAIPPFPPYILSEEKQQTVEPFLIGQNGRWVSIRGEGQGGLTDVLGIQVEGIPSAKEGVKTLA